MGICVSYRVKKLKSLKDRQKTILKAKDIAGAILGEFKELESTLYVNKKCENLFINFNGEGYGCESLVFGFNETEGVDEGKGSIFQFTKTQYAKNFEKTHVAVCEIVAAWEKAGIVTEVDDEAGYLPDRKFENLSESKKEMDDIIGKVLGLLKKEGWDELEIKTGPELEKERAKIKN